MSRLWYLAEVYTCQVPYVIIRRHSSTVQRVNFVGYTGGEGGGPRLWNLQNLHAVPPYKIALSRSTAPLGLKLATASEPQGGRTLRLSRGVECNTLVAP